MLIASVGSGLAAELGIGLSPAFAADGPERLLQIDREPLVGLMQQTPADKLLRLVRIIAQERHDFQGTVGRTSVWPMPVLLAVGITTAIMLSRR